jgi:hypothetical protein
LLGLLQRKNKHVHGSKFSAVERAITVENKKGGHDGADWFTVIVTLRMLSLTTDAGTSHEELGVTHNGRSMARNKFYNG